jgi:hypothetical protein
VLTYSQRCSGFPVGRECIGTLVGQTPRAFSPNRTRRETGEAGENLRFITALSARDLILQGKARSDETDTLGAHFVAAPPDHFVCVFPDYTVTGTEQHEFIGSVESVKEEPHAAVGDVVRSRSKDGAANIAKPPRRLRTPSAAPCAANEKFSPGGFIKPDQHVVRRRDPLPRRRGY